MTDNIESRAKEEYEANRMTSRDMFVAWDDLSDNARQVVVERYKERHPDEAA